MKSRERILFTKSSRVLGVLVLWGSTFYGNAISLLGIRDGFWAEIVRNIQLAHNSVYPKITQMPVAARVPFDIMASGTFAKGTSISPQEAFLAIMQKIPISPQWFTVISGKRAPNYNALMQYRRKLEEEKGLAEGYYSDWTALPLPEETAKTYEKSIRTFVEERLKKLYWLKQAKDPRAQAVYKQIESEMYDTVSQYGRTCMYIVFLAPVENPVRQADMGPYMSDILNLRVGGFLPAGTNAILVRGSIFRPPNLPIQLKVAWAQTPSFVIPSYVERSDVYYYRVLRIRDYYLLMASDYGMIEPKLFAEWTYSGRVDNLDIEVK